MVKTHPPTRNPVPTLETIRMRSLDVGLTKEQIAKRGGTIGGSDANRIMAGGGPSDEYSPTQLATMALCSLAGDILELERIAREHPSVILAEGQSLRGLIDRLAGVVVGLETKKVK